MKLVAKNPLTIYFRENQVTLAIGTPVTVRPKKKRNAQFFIMDWENEKGVVSVAEISKGNYELNLCTEAELRKEKIDKIIK